VTTVRQLAPEPARQPLGQRRDHDLVEVLLLDGRLHRDERVGPSDQGLHGLADLTLDRGEVLLQRPFRGVAVQHVRHEQHEAAWAFLGFSPKLPEQLRAGRRSVGYYQDPV
jgi:hypothetical protein